MDKTFKIYLAVLLGVILVVFFIQKSRPKPVDWTPTYSLDNKNPLDLYVFNHEVDKIVQKGRLKRVTETPYEYISKNKSKVNFLIIKQNAYDYIDSTLLKEVSKGNNLWISAENYVKSFTDTLKLQYADADPSISLRKIDSIKLRLCMNSWHAKTFYLRPVLNSFTFTKMDSSVTAILGTTRMPDNVVFPNFIRIKYGKGYIYLHNQPQVFTNVALLSDASSADYVAHILSYITHDKPVVWFVKGQTRNTGEPLNETILSVIFRYPALRATWLLFIYGMLLHILFNAKRRQRVVPVINPLKNTTVEFVQTIGNLYFLEGDIPNIVEKKIIYFLDRIRHRYYLDTNKLDESFADKLHSKSGKDKALIDSILHFINDFEKTKSARQTDLVKLNSLTEDFWKEENKTHN